MMYETDEEEKKRKKNKKITFKSLHNRQELVTNPGEITSNQIFKKDVEPIKTDEV